MTLECVRALERARVLNVATYEIVLVDDASTEDTSVLASTSARIVRNESNLGYLRSTNRGASFAVGRFIHLLNNDTEVVGSFLDPLVDLLDRRSRATMVGSRLVYPNGVLQEAGSMIFNDGTGWNFGNGHDPEHAFYAFERPTRYCSAASLLVRRTFWEEVGGFDERYAPAYYEDTDLAMESWSRGGEVWYEPHSLVVHHGGASHGTDLQSGGKRSQEINRQVFRTKWASALEALPTPSAENAFLGRAVSPLGHVIMVDHEVPTPDRDSGSLRITRMMEILLDLGFSVTFCAHNNLLSPDRIARLTSLGIEVWGDPTTWGDHIASDAAGTRLVWIARPAVAHTWMGWFRKRFPQIPVVFDTVDLHSVRQARQRAVLGEASLAGQELFAEDDEVGLARSADAVVVVSDDEAIYLRERGVANVVVVPNVHEAPDPWMIRSGLTGRRMDALFVGGFRHPPNIDAAESFIGEVLPLVRDRIPEFGFRVVGADITEDLRRRFDAPGVTVVGHLPSLARAYGEAGVVVAPLRFGAGLKGKVGEAMSYGVPIVLTPTAAEGFRDFRAGRVAVSAVDFAAAVVELLTDPEAWRACADVGPGDVARQLGPTAVRNALVAELLPAIGVQPQSGL